MSELLAPIPWEPPQPTVTLTAIKERWAGNILEDRDLDWLIEKLDGARRVLDDVDFELPAGAHVSDRIHEFLQEIDG